MTIITVSSLKGGVGKTTLACFTARALAKSARVLCVDLDHNNNLTDYWLRDWPVDEIEVRNISGVLSRTVSIDQSTWMRDPVDVIPATPSLSRISALIGHDQNVAARLRTALRKLDYDYIIIDTPPSLSLELSIGLNCADRVLVPVSASRWTLQGYQIIADEVAGIVESTGREVPMLAVPSMVTEKEADSLRRVTEWKTTVGAVYRDQTIKAAASEGRALREGTNAAGWFAGLAEEVGR